MYGCTCTLSFETLTSGRGSVTPASLRTLLSLVEMTKGVGRGEEGEVMGGVGMGELVRNELFPLAEEVSAFALQFGVLPGEEEEGGGEKSKTCLCVRKKRRGVPYTHAHAFIHSYTHVLKHLRPHTPTYSYIYVLMHTLLQSYMYTHPLVHPCTHAFIHTLMPNTHTLIHSYPHTH